MSVVIERISRSGDEIDSVVVIYKAVVVIIDGVARDFLWIVPHVRREIGVIVINPSVDNQNERLVISAAGGVVPC
jgi:hypothetical protein